MPLLSDRFYIDKLNRLHINIKSQYIVGNQFLERNTDNSKNETIQNGILCSKEYYVNHVLKHVEKEFDSRMEYTFVSETDNDKTQVCPNCGLTASLKEFINGCPYCGTHYNMEYTDKELGSKHHYDRVVKSSLYRFVTAIIDFAVSLFLCYLFVKSTSRIFGTYEYYKILIYGIILSLILYYFFYMADAYVILGPIKRWKDKQNEKQIAFWKETGIDKKKFFNNFNFELRKYFYEKEEIIDYDILDYLSFKEIKKGENREIEVKIEVRLISLKDEKIISKIEKETFVMVKTENKPIELSAGVNIVKCNGCGASVDILSGKCSYCGNKLENYGQEYILKK